MVEKITVEIGLDGGEEVNQQLEGILKTGQKTFSGLEDAANQLDFSAIADGFQNVGDVGVKAFDKIQAAAKSTVAWEQVIQGLKTVEGAFDKLGTAATRMATRMTKSLGLFGVLARSFGPVGIAAGVAGGALIKFGNDSAKALSELNVEAAKVGMTVQQFDKIQKGMAKLGIAVNTVASGIAKFKETAASGLFTRDFMPGDEIQGMQNFYNVLSRMPDGFERTQLAAARFGEAMGAQVILLLQAGTTAQAFGDSMRSVTPATAEAQAAAARYEVSLNKLSGAWTNFKTNLTGPVATPAIDWLTTQIPGIEAGINNTVREFVALGSAIDAVASAGAAGIKFLVDAIMGAVNAVTNFASSLGTINVDIIGALVRDWNAVTGAIGGAIDKLLQYIGLQSKVKPPAQFGGPTGGGGIGTVGGKAAGGLLGGRGTGTSDSNLAWVSRGEHIMPARVVRQRGVLALLEALRRGGGIPGYADGGAVGGSGSVGFVRARSIDQIVGAINELARSISDEVARETTLTRGFETLSKYIQSTTQWLGDLVARESTLTDGVSDILNAISKLTPAAKAAGGLLGGRGTGTSDSNLAWVSRGEYIMPARVVQQSGMLAFLEALRRGGGFALGGLVRGPIPAYAGGGSVGSMNHVTIQFPGLPAIGGLRASSDVVDQLHKAAALAQVRSGGRKPSRYT